MSERFEKCLAIILQFEGGFSDDPVDRGGATNKGIIQSEYNRYRSHKNLDERSVRYIEDDEVRDIYFNEFWLPSRCELMPEPLDLVMFDGAVNHGDGREMKFLQRSLDVAADGVWGPTTNAALQSALNSQGPKSLALELIQQRILFYHQIVEHDASQNKFLHGWLNRMSSLEKMMGDSHGLA